MAPYFHSISERERDLCKEHGVEILTWEHPHFPASLKNIADAPPVLYAKGDLKVLEKPCIAIVGSRAPTPYGEKIAQNLARDLAEAGVVTASGLARGIDAFVHRATLEMRGSTIAVLGSGLLDIYPPEHKNLAAAVSQQGFIISEFPLRTPPIAKNFPQRNRLISGLSLGTVVVEAHERSGALITARFAAEQGKEVFAVPGPVSSILSAGPNKLIKMGAKLVESALDILEEIGPLKNKFYECQNQMKSAKGGNPFPERLNVTEAVVLKQIYSEPMHIDSILRQCGLKQGELAAALLNLEIKGRVKTLPGQRYVRA